jgi:predicted RNase H-like HicB family nuclease
MTDYLVIYETDEHGGWGGYSPDLPGVFAVGRTREEVELRMSEAIPLHIEALREAGLSIPTPHHEAGRVAA